MAYCCVTSDYCSSWSWGRWMCDEFTSRNSDFKWRAIAVFRFWVVSSTAEAFPSKVIHLFLPGCRHLIGLNFPTHYLLTFYCRYNILIAHYINGTYNKSNKVLFVWGRQCKGLVMCVSECLQSRSDWLKNNWFILTCSHLHSFSPSGRSLLSSTDIMCSGPVFFQV